MRLLDAIRLYHQRSNPAPRIHEFLRAEGNGVGRKRAATIMRSAGTSLLSRRCQTRGGALAFTPVQIWSTRTHISRSQQHLAAAITCSATSRAFLQFATVMDLLSLMTLAVGTRNGQRPCITCVP